MIRQGNQGRSLPSDVKVSALGKRVARLRHGYLAYRVMFEAVAVVAVFAVSAWVLLILMIGAVPLHR